MLVPQLGSLLHRSAEDLNLPLLFLFSCYIVHFSICVELGRACSAVSGDGGFHSHPALVITRCSFLRGTRLFPPQAGRFGLCSFDGYEFLVGFAPPFLPLLLRVLPPPL